jgi:AcrR family transcriptional regulator
MDNINQDPGSAEKILEAARKVFQQKGYHGARMQEIADEAGISKASLHYYFRSKEKLFGEIFREAFGQFIPSMQQLMGGDNSLEQKMHWLIRRYIALLEEHPSLPQFILSEINRDPESIGKLFLETGVRPEALMAPLLPSLSAAYGKDRDPRHFLVNVVAMTIFPYAARPLLERILFNGDGEAYDRFLSERSQLVPEAAMRSLSQKDPAQNSEL